MFVLIILRKQRFKFCMNKYHVDEVKIVSECRRIFTFQNVLRNAINTTTLD
jgi:hypothetical protein